MDLQAVQAATGPELAAPATAAARNACDLLDEADVLAKAGYWARACALAGLSIRAPVGRMLGWHQWKQAEGQVVAVVPYRPPGIGAGLLRMPEASLSKLMSEYEVQAEEADRQLAQARRAVASAVILRDPQQNVLLQYPHVERARLARAVVDALAAKVQARTPYDAADVMLASVSRARSD
jgi:hypothetical protein